MFWELNFQEYAILEIKANGKFSNYDLLIMAEEIVRDPRWKSGMNTIADFRNVVSIGIKYSDLWLSRDIHAQFDNMVGKSKIAVILESDLGILLSRAYEIISRMHVRSKIKTFKDYWKGVEWIRGKECF